MRPFRKALRKLDHVFPWILSNNILDCDSAVLKNVKKISMTSNVLPLHFSPSQASSNKFKCWQLLKFNKSQKYFFLRLHCPKNEYNFVKYFAYYHMFLQKLFQHIVSTLLRNQINANFFCVLPNTKNWHLQLTYFAKNVLQYICWLSFPFLTSIT